MAKKQRGAKRGGAKKSRNIFSTLLIIAGLALLLVAGGMYARNWMNYREIDEVNERVVQYATLAADDGPPTVDWEGLKAINPDVVGWIQVPGTVVNYPVFQGGDNEYYLHHAPDKSSTLGGSVFLDYESTKPGLVDRQSIVYGHHMRNGSQFKQIADMDSQESFDGVNTVWYVTEEGTYNLAPLFVFYTSDADLDVRQLKFETTKKYREYLKSYFDKAVTKREGADEAIKVVDHLFTLSTCNYIDGYGRTVLVCAPKNEIPGTAEYKAAKQQRDKLVKEAEAEQARKLAEEQQQWDEALAAWEYYVSVEGNTEEAPQPEVYDEFGNLLEERPTEAPDRVPTAIKDTES